MALMYFRVSSRIFSLTFVLGPENFGNSIGHCCVGVDGTSGHGTSGSGIGFFLGRPRPRPAVTELLVGMEGLVETVLTTL